MNKLTVLAMIVAMLMLSVLAGSALAAPGEPPHLNWGSEVNPGQCPPGRLVINVTHKVTNDIDSAVGGDFWATDTYSRHIQAWEVAPGTFCAVVQYYGAFITDDGPSPQGTDLDGIAAGITGTFEGGYRGSITGSLNPSPARPTQGNIGTFDYGCDVDAGACATPFSWLGTYFTPGYGFAYDWWGWVYHGGSNGTWVNASTGNSGDITD